MYRRLRGAQIVRRYPFLMLGDPLSGLWLFVAVVFFVVGITFALMGYLAVRDRKRESPKTSVSRWQAGSMNDADQPQIVKGLYQLHIDGGKKASEAGEKGDGAIGVLLKEPNGTVIEGAEISERIKDPVAGPTTAGTRPY